MASPLVRVIVTTLAGYLCILLFLFVYDWVGKEYPKRPAGPVASEGIRHPFHHQEAVTALQMYSRLPPSEETALQHNLKLSVIPLASWLTGLSQSSLEIICMGELHEDATRDFLAEKFFTRLRTDVLMLEATPGELKRLFRRVRAGREYFPLLDADIMTVLRRVRDKNPAVKMYGIEETGKQAGQADDRHFNSRDQSIAKNFWASFRPGLRHIILFGALHCMDEPGWLYHTLSSQSSPGLREKMLNVRVVEEHQIGSVEAFVYFLDQVGVERRTFVIPDTRSLSSHIYRWFPALNRQVLGKYGAVIVFRANGTSS